MLKDSNLHMLIKACTEYRACSQLRQCEAWDWAWNAFPTYLHVLSQTLFHYVCFCHCMCINIFNKHFHILQARSYSVFWNGELPLNILLVHILFIAASPSNRCSGYQGTGATATSRHVQGDDGRRGQQRLGAGTILQIRQNYTGRSMQTVCHCSQENRNCAHCNLCYGQGVIRHNHRRTHMRHLVLRREVITPTSQCSVYNSAYSGNDKWDAQR